MRRLILIALMFSCGYNFVTASYHWYMAKFVVPETDYILYRLHRTTWDVDILYSIIIGLVAWWSFMVEEEKPETATPEMLKSERETRIHNAILNLDGVPKGLPLRPAHFMAVDVVVFTIKSVTYAVEYHDLCTWECQPEGGYIGSARAKEMQNRIQASLNKLGNV